MVSTVNRFKPLEVASPLRPSRKCGDNDIFLILEKNQVDRADKDVSGRFPEGFSVELQLTRWSPEKPGRSRRGSGT